MVCHWEVGPYLLPLFICLLLPITFLTTYAIAVSLRHVDAVFPYISKTGSYSPESCIYGQVLNLVAVIVLGAVYVRYRQVAEFHNSPSSPRRLVKLNRASLYIGVLAALGVSMVGNFQESAVRWAHILGNLMAYAMGVAFCLIHTYTSYRMHPHMTSLIICHLRFALSVLISISIVLTLISTPVAYGIHALEQNTTLYNTYLFWNPEKQGFPAHVVSTISLWFNAVAMLIYVSTYVKEFRRITLYRPPMVLRITPLEMFAVAVSGDKEREYPATTSTLLCQARDLPALAQYTDSSAGNAGGRPVVGLDGGAGGTGDTRQMPRFVLHTDAAPGSRQLDEAAPGAQASGKDIGAFVIAHDAAAETPLIAAAGVGRSLVLRASDSALLRHQHATYPPPLGAVAAEGRSKPPARNGFVLASPNAAALSILRRNSEEDAPPPRENGKRPGACQDLRKSDTTAANRSPECTGGIRMDNQQAQKAVNDLGFYPKSSVEIGGVCPQESPLTTSRSEATGLCRWPEEGITLAQS